MPLICEDCPNKTNFKKYAYGRASYSETVYYDQNGDEHNWEDCEYDQEEQTDSSGEECAECGSTRIADVSEQEWRAWKGVVAKNWKDKMESD